VHSPQGRLLSLAERLAEECPREIGREIAVMGSIAAGLADDYSDLELLLLVDEVPSVDCVRGWLRAVGGESVLAGPGPDGVWAWCRVEGVEVEPFWGSIADARSEVDAILAGEAIEHPRLAFAHVLAHAVVLRDAGVIAELAKRCEPYPEEVAQRLIADGLTGLEVPSARLGGALRDDRVALEGFFLSGAHRILRILFALNRRWEPPRWKWLRHYASELPLAPARLTERLEGALVEPDAVAGARLLQELFQEVLDLLPAEVNAGDARRATSARLLQIDALLAQEPA
jgi:hypothetical protein